MNQLFIRKAHRWLGTFAALQLLIWTGSGLFFAISPIDDIRGSHLTSPSASLRLGHVQLISPSNLVKYNKELAMVSLKHIKISQRLHTPVYIINAEEQKLVFNAETGEKLTLLNQMQAEAIATNNTTRAILSSTLIKTVQRDSEYRDGELPAWKIKLEGPEHPNLWIGANSGRVNAIRTTNWRIYDFLWSLHIMDYVERKNFNSWLLKGFALLGLITILSGVLLLIPHTLFKKKTPASR